jgi:tetratricopeptide (TPR) repeat protein
MTLFKADDPARTRTLRAKAEEAIALALRNRWPEAVEANRAILEATPEDIDALNRLAKALLELGRTAEAREAVNRAVALAPTNAIARKNAERLMRLEAQQAAEQEPPSTPGHASFSLDLFIEEAGKSTTTTLVEPGEPGVLHRLTGGEAVNLVRDGARLLVRSRRGEYVGRVQPRLAQRVISLLEAGNRYAAAVLQSTDQETRVIVREVHQDASMAGKPSFPPLRPDGFRPYVRGGRSLVYYDLAEPAMEAADDGGEEGEETLDEPRPRSLRGDEDEEEES